jgi:hypothetical protein
VGIEAGDDDGVLVGDVVGAKVEHAPLEHRPARQSESKLQYLSIEHGPQFGPPQSTSLSPLSCTPFVHSSVLGATVGVEVGTVLGSAEGEFVGIAVGSCVGKEDGVDVGAALGANVTHTPAELHELCLQSESRAHSSPIRHGAQSGPPQSTSVSSPSFTPFTQVPPVGPWVGATDGTPVGDDVGNKQMPTKYPHVAAHRSMKSEASRISPSPVAQ